MSEIIIPIPPLDEIHEPIEIEVKINGKKKKFNYRVEALDLQKCVEIPPERVKCIQDMIANYSTDWQLYQIGNPSERVIPILFREKVKTE